MKALAADRSARVSAVKRSTAVASKSHLNQATIDYLEAAVGMCGYVVIGSSLKFCIVAEGEADIYPRAAPTSEWDTAAGHAVLLAAGGLVDGPDGHALHYGKPAFLNRGFVATSGWKPPSRAFLAGIRGRRRPARRAFKGPNADRASTEREWSNPDHRQAGPSQSSQPERLNLGARGFQPADKAPSPRARPLGSPSARSVAEPARSPRQGR